MPAPFAECVQCLLFGAHLQNTGRRPSHNLVISMAIRLAFQILSFCVLCSPLQSACSERVDRKTRLLVAMLAHTAAARLLLVLVLLHLRTLAGWLEVG